MRRAILAVLLTASALPLHAGGMTECRMTFSLKGWSAFYKVAHGTGMVTCGNGQRAAVTIEAKGGGLTFGRSEIRDGIGKFSEVASIKDVFGTYVSSGADAGAGKSTVAMAMTKGEVSLALTGKGSGVTVGVSFGKFTITRK